MDYCTLGRSGLRVSRLNLGAMTFGAGTGIWNPSLGWTVSRRHGSWRWPWSEA